METQSLGHSKNQTNPNEIFEKISNGNFELSKFENKFDSKPDNNLNFTSRKDANPIITRTWPNGLQKVKPINGPSTYETTMTHVHSLPMITDMLLDQSKI